MKKYKAKKARLVRENLAWLLAFHIAFCMLEVFVYEEFVFKVFAFELFYMWLAYYSYMTLSWYSTYIYIGVMAMAPIIGLYSVFDINHYHFFKSCIYTFQLGIYAYFGVYKLLDQWRQWLKAKKENELKLEEIKKLEKEVSRQSVVSVKLDNQNEDSPFGALQNQIDKRRGVVVNSSECESSFTSPAKRDSVFVPVKIDATPPPVRCPSPRDIRAKIS